MKNKKAVAALVAVAFWFTVAASVALSTSQDALLDNGGVPSLLVEDGATAYSLMRVLGGASGSIRVSIVGTGYATNTMTIQPIKYCETRATTVTAGATSTTALNPTTTANSYMVANETGTNLRFAINGAVATSSMYLPAYAIIANGNDLEVTSFGVWNSGATTASVTVQFCRH